MSYINPFLVNAEEKGNVRRNLYLEAKEKGYLIQNLEGEEYAIMNTSFSAALVDLSNPEAYEWLKAVIRDELIAVGARGWMADFGEAPPFDIRLHSARTPSCGTTAIQWSDASEPRPSEKPVEKGTSSFSIAVALPTVLVTAPSFGWEITNSSEKDGIRCTIGY